MGEIYLTILTIIDVINANGKILAKKDNICRQLGKLNQQAP